MSNVLEYILSVKDRGSSNLKRIGISSDIALAKFAKLEKQGNEVNKTMLAMGNSVGSLKQKLDHLKAERDWIPASQVNTIKNYNREISSLEKQIAKMEGRAGGWGAKLRESVNQIPGVSAIANPIVAIGGALFGATKMSYDFKKGMAAINTTAQLGQRDLSKLQNELLSIDPKFVKDWKEIPGAYESIISQTGDVAQSTDILKTSLKGAKAGFTDTKVVTGSLAQSLSVIGKENANATQVLDTFFAAKRVGAGEFQDLARYMPGLIASGAALSINYKEVAGMFAYMTGKGQSAERSAVLMENAFSAMSKIDIRKNLKNEGINVFDEKGSIRSMTSIFGDLKKKMSSMNDEEKSSFLAKMGLTDKEARSAFILMTKDMNKLKETMHDVGNAQGETDKALKFAASDSDRMAETWSVIQLTAIKLGGALSSVLNPAFRVAGWVIGHVADTLTWLVDGVSNADPAVLALVGGVTALTIAYKWSTISMKAQDMWLNILILKERLMGAVTKAKAIAMGVATVATYAMEAAQWALNAAFVATPIGWIVGGLALVGGAIYGVTRLMNQQTASQRLNSEVRDRAMEKTAEQKSELEIMFQKLRQAKVGTDDYKNALKDLEAAYPGIIDKYNLQKGSLDDINAAHRALIANIDAVAMQEARKDLLKEKYKEQFQKEADMKHGKLTTWESFLNATGGGDGVKGLHRIELNSIKNDAKLLTEDIANNEMKANNASNFLKDAKTGDKKSLRSKVTTSTKDKVDAAVGYDTEESIKARIQELEDQKSKMELGGKDWKKTGKEIERLQRKLNPGKGSGGAGSKSNEATATGGAKQTMITLNFKNIIETQNISGKDFKEATEDLQQQSTDAIVRVLNMATTTAG